jgi:1-acyl-sn-glycerol-3-phosphate acyltransferase
MLSILYYLFTLLQVTFFFILSIVVLVITYPFDKSRRWVHECSRCICWLLFGVPPRVKRTIDGLENIDKNKSYVMVLNHNSGVDIFAAYKIPLNFRWVSKREVFRIPFFGQMLTLHGDICIDRSSSGAMSKVTTLGKKWLGRGASVAIFPEGTRSKDGEIHRFKSGAFTLAKEAGVPILPVVFHGSDTLFRNGWRLPLRHTFRVDVLDPIPAEVVASMELRELSDMVREQMVAAKEVQKNMND